MSDIAVITDFPRKTREIENTWIPMPDGTRLAARIWLPEDAEDDPVPAILEYLPYRKRDGTVARDALTHPYFAGHGYAGVRVDMRGTGDSDGVCLGEYLKQEQDDAMVILDWLAAQPWCSGKVGMIGISWGGFNGLQIAARRPPALRAVISLCSTDDRYADDIHFMGGAVLCDKLNWGATAFSISNTPPDPAIVGDNWREMWRERLDNNGLWMLDWFRHQRRDAFYAHGSVCENYADIDVPVYMVGGWADGYTNAVFRTLDHLPGPKKGLVGPWAHKYPHFAQPGPRIGFLQECLRWWDQHLKGKDTGIMDEPQLRAFVQEPAPPAPYRAHREGRWVAEPHWQGTAVDVLSLHVDPAGPNGLSEAATDQSLTLCSPQNAGSAAGVWCVYGLGADGPLDQNDEQGRLSAFESAPLEEDVELLGFPMLHVQVASDVPQANLVATLSAVDAEGRATLLTFGVLNLTHRNSHATPEPMPPGTPQPVSVQLNVCGQRIAKGQKIRLSLGTAFWPVIWPSQCTATLTVSDARLDLPQRPARASDADLSPFQRPESAPPLETEQQGEGSYSRTRTIDQATGVETIEYASDTGAETHLHSGMTVHYTSSDSFSIHPDDPNSATGTCRWRKAYARGDWHAEVRTEVTVRALADSWAIEARLVAEDAEGIVTERSWREDIPRDLV